MTSSSNKQIQRVMVASLLSIPLWGLLIAAIITKNTIYITALVVLFGTILATLVTLKIRASGKRKQELIRIWRDGEAGTARIISIGEDGSGMNGHLNIDFVLEVTLDGRDPYRASSRVLISKLAIPRIQPDCEVVVRVDTNNPQTVLVDPALTPYQHYGPEGQ